MRIKSKLVGLASLTEGKQFWRPCSFVAVFRFQGGHAQTLDAGGEEAAITLKPKVGDEGPSGVAGGPARG